MNSKSILIAFTGPEINQAESIAEISSGYECWNLRRFTIDSFLSELQSKIPPLNDNVLRNYRAPEEQPNPDFGIRQSDYDHCSWALLLPGPTLEAFGGYGEALFLLNLYSPRFLYPEFFATDFGVDCVRRAQNRLLFFHDQNQAARFKRVEFVRFYEELLPESVYATWQADLVAHWTKEEWRLFAASLLFSELKQYENNKQVFGWPREAADLATILEALFTAGGDDNTEIGYKLRKRMAVLVSRHIPNIEAEMKELYKQRSAFVHGSFFRQIHKETVVKRGLAQLPAPPFQFLYREKELVRIALVAYLYLHKTFEADRNVFGKCASVFQVLEEAIIDTDLRATVEKNTANILSLL